VRVADRIVSENLLGGLMHGVHIFPRGDNDAAVFCRNIVTAYSKYVDVYKYRDKAFWDKYAAHVKTFENALLGLATDKRSSSLIIQKNEARRYLEAETTKIYRFIQAHPSTTDDIRMQFAFHIYKKTHTKSTPPTHMVEGSVTNNPVDHIHIFRYRPLDTNKRGCGGLYDRVELRIFVCNENENPPVNPEQYPRCVFVRHSPARITFPPEQAGLIAYYAARFINSVGMPGPWAILECFRIP
jgi:hypothetical protein